MTPLLSPKAAALMTGLVLAAFPNLAAAKEITLKSTRAQITKVVDGDTFDVYLPKDHRSETVRVLGIDCPEKKVNDKCIRENGGLAACKQNEVPLGIKAKSVADVMTGNTVTLTGHKPGNTFKTDKYGRILAYVEDGRGDYGLRMVKGGFCEDNSDKFNHPRGPDYQKAQGH